VAQNPSSKCRSDPEDSDDLANAKSLAPILTELPCYEREVMALWDHASPMVGREQGDPMKHARKSKKRPSTAKNPEVERLRKQALVEIGQRLARPNVATTATRGAKEGSKAKSLRSNRTGPTSAATSPTAKASRRLETGEKTASHMGKNAKPSKLGALSASAQILAGSKKAMRVKEIFAAIKQRGLWTTSGKTPFATLHAAISREIKGKNSRFRKAGRGLFAATKAG